MESIAIALLCSIISASISFLTFQRNGKKDVQAEIKERVEMTTLNSTTVLETSN